MGLRYTNVNMPSLVHYQIQSQKLGGNPGLVKT